MSTKDLSKHAVGADLDHLKTALESGIKRQNAVPKLISVIKGLPALSAADLEESQKEGEKTAATPGKYTHKQLEKHSAKKADKKRSAIEAGGATPSDEKKAKKEKN
jgi:hypothetical protein